MNHTTEGTNTVGGGRRRLRRLIRSRTVRALSAIVTVAALAASAAAADDPAGLPAVASSPPSVSAQESGMIAGQPLADPPDVDVVPGGAGIRIVLETTDAYLDVAGRRIWGRAYNGSFVGPTLHLVPGQLAEIMLVNHLTKATNLHFHGMHVTPADDGDNPNVCVPPGESFVYRLKIPANHPQGTFWYHSHAMGTSCDPPEKGHWRVGDTENQIFSGLSGAVVVGDIRTALPPQYLDVPARTLVLKDVQLDGDGRIVQNTETTKIDSDAPTARLVNGQLRPVLDVRPGQTQLWRLVNAGADISYRVALDGFRFAVIGEDGRPAAAVTTPSSLLLTPGKRFDVLVTAPTAAGSATLRTAAFDTGPTGDSYPDTVLAQVTISGTPETPLPVPAGPLPGAPADLSNAPMARQRTVTLSEDSETGQFTINGQPFMMDTSVFAEPAILNTVEEWTILNDTGEDHPFHLHTNAFQVMSVDGVAEPYSGLQDGVMVPHSTRRDGPPGQVVVRIKFADFPGRWFFHCHIASHEDNGMMSFINVVPTPVLAPTQTLPYTP